MEPENDLWAALVAAYPNGAEELLRFGLNQVLGVASDADVTEYLPRLTIVKHSNGFVVVRLDDTAEQAGPILFALGAEQKGDRKSGWQPTRPVYFGQQAQHHEALNLLRLQAARQLSPGTPA